MYSNLSVNSTNPCFQAKISSNLRNAAKNFYSGSENEAARVKHFDNCTNRFYRYGFDKAVVDFEIVSEDGKKQFVLYAQDGDRKVILSKKDQFRKILEKFMHMSGFEFGVKMTKK